MTTKTKFWLAAFLCVCTTPAHAQDDRIPVPGGINVRKFANLWSVAKMTCLELGYAIANEDREIRTIYCTRSVEMGTNSMRVTFFNDAFSVTTNGVARGIPLLGNLHRRNKRKMIEALSSAASTPLRR